VGLDPAHAPRLALRRAGVSSGLCSQRPTANHVCAGQAILGGAAIVVVRPQYAMLASFNSRDHVFDAYRSQSGLRPAAR
jgi:hypothetical protein